MAVVDPGLVVAGFFGGLGFQLAKLPLTGLEKAVIEPVSQRLFERTFAEITPYLGHLFDRLDPLLPEAIASKTPAELEDWFMEQAEAITGRRWPRSQAEIFWRRLDVRKIAARLHPSQTES